MAIKYVINPKSDAVAHHSEILYGEYIFQGEQHPDNWLIVYLADGRKLESELLKNQPNLEQTMEAMYLAGIRIYKRNARPARLSHVNGHGPLCS